MKKRFFTFYTLFTFSVLVSFLVSGCSSNETFLDQWHPATQEYYFAETENSPIIETDYNTIDGFTLSLSASQAKAEIRMVFFEKDPNKLKELETIQKMNCELLPEGSYSLSSNAFVFEKDQKQSSKVIFHLMDKKNLKDNTTYCLPIKITSASDGTVFTEKYKTVYLVLKTGTTYAALFKYDTRYSAPFKDKGIAPLTEFTLETRLNASSFKNTFPYISTIMGIEGDFVLRFGDEKLAPNKLQFFYKGTKMYFIKPFNTNEWYHIALVYNGEVTKLYVNGEFIQEHYARLDPLDLTASPTNIGFQVSQYSNWDDRYFIGAFSEMRIWRKAVSVEDLKKYASYLPKAKRDGLVAYWPFNNQAEIIKDLSGNGFDLTPSENEIEQEPFVAPEWISIN